MNKLKIFLLSLNCFGFLINSVLAEVDVEKKLNPDNKIEEIKTQELKKDDNLNKDNETKKTAERRVINNIVVRVNGSNILRSDLQQQIISKAGETFTLQEAISEELFFQKAAERKLLPAESEVEKQISTLKIHNGLGDLSEEEFEKELDSEGFTLQEYKKQLARMLAVEKLKHAEFNERVVVTSQQVNEYYKNNPEWSAEKYLLKVCDIPNDYVDENGELVKNDDLKWDDLGWIEKADMSLDLAFVAKMRKGEISKPQKINDQYQLVKLEDGANSYLRTFDERYLEIEKTLHYQKKSTFEKVFEGELREDASIVYLV